MYIKSIQLQDFRNYESLNVNFSEGINILYGDNAQGKTNLLEAIFMAATTKSYRGSKEKEVIRMTKDEAHIRLVMNKAENDRRIDMHLKKNNSKGVAIDGLRISKSSELYGLLHVISFSPEDLAIVKSGPSERRRFLDMELCQLDRLYIRDLYNYNKTLVQRNNLLKQLDRDKSLIDTISVWDESLAGYGVNIIKRRRAFIEEIKNLLREKHAKISGGLENLLIEYKPNTEEDNFREKLKTSLERDMFLKATSAGPHKDDINFYINGDNVRSFGSQGQQRSTALSLKLAEIELVKKTIGDSPVLLLDDVLSELDRNRQMALLNETEEVQTFITCTGLEEFVEKQKRDRKIFHVVGGRLS